MAEFELKPSGTQFYWNFQANNNEIVANRRVLANQTAYISDAGSSSSCASSTSVY